MSLSEIVIYSLAVFVQSTVLALGAIRFWCYLDWIWAGQPGFNEDGPDGCTGMLFKVLMTEIPLTLIVLAISWSLFSWPALFIILILKVALYRFLSTL